MAGAAVTVSSNTHNAPSGPIPPIVYGVAIIAALAGLLFGLDIGIISGALPFLGQKFHTSDSANGMIVSAILIGAVLGTFCSGPISRNLGRKTTLLISAVIFVIGSVGSGVAMNPLTLISVRVFLGLAVGIASFTAPLYLSEMAPHRIRGALISLYQLMITIGILLAFISDQFIGQWHTMVYEIETITHNTNDIWRPMLMVPAIPAVGMFIGILFLPRSPRWLMLQGYKEQAIKVLQKLRSSREEIDWEINEIEQAAAGNDHQTTWQLIDNRNFQKVLVLGICLQIAQQFTGINVMMYFAPEIFKQAGFQTVSQQMWGTIIIGITNVLATFIAIAFVDKFGRKPILYTGYAIMAIAMGIVGTTFCMGIDQSTTLQYICIAFLMVFIIGFAMSAGPIIWVICSEIYPLAGRDLGITVSTATNWIANAIIGYLFLIMLHKLGGAQTFWIFGLLNFLFIFLLLFWTPETKDVSLEDIERNLLAGKPLKEIGA